MRQMQYIEAYQSLRKELKALGLSPREVEAETAEIMEAILGKKVFEIILSPKEEISPTQEQAFSACLQGRKQRMPLAYLLKERYFYGLSFYVTPDVLIPRQETEELVEAAVQLIENKKLQTVLDICTGSGAIGLAIAAHTMAQVTLSDISAAALCVAEKNAARLGVQARLVQSDLFAQICGKYDMITANPPYIAAEEFAEMQPEVTEYEPRLALDGGRDGLLYYEKIAKKAGAYLAEDGYLLLEIGMTQGNAVTGVLQQNGFAEIVVKKDYAGHDRFIIAQRERE